MVDAVAQFFTAAEHHRGGSAQSKRMRDAMDFFPIVTGAFEARDFGTDFVVENFRAAPGDGLQTGVHQALDGFAHADFGTLGDAQDCRRGETVQMHLREARFQGAQQIFVVADLQVGMQAALQENAGAAKFQHPFDFFVDGFKREDVAVFGAERPVKGAERTILGAEVGVVNVAIDLVGDHARVVLRQAHLVRLHADADQVVGFEHLDRLLFCQSHVDSFYDASILAAMRPETVRRPSRSGGCETFVVDENRNCRRVRSARRVRSRWHRLGVCATGLFSWAMVSWLVLWRRRVPRRSWAWLRRPLRPSGARSPGQLWRLPRED